MKSVSSRWTLIGSTLVARTSAVALLGALAIAQNDIKSRLMPITTTPRRAGVYHVATGTWTRNGNLADVTGPDIIYNNSCAPVYFISMISGEKFQHRSRVPTTAANGAPTTPSPHVSGGNDEAPGCNTSYLVNGFEIMYCTSRPISLGVFNMDFEFADAYSTCGSSDMIPNQTFNVPLPPDTGTAGQSCWIVDVDLDGTGQSFTLQADQDGTYVGPSTAEQFGYSQGPTTSGITLSQATGPVFAGNYTWTGGPFTGPLTLCTGTDGTIWDSPINLAEEGTGMASLDAFRATGITSFPSGPGCFFIRGTTIHNDFYLKLLADAGCTPPSPMVQNCFPGTGGIIPCPCDPPLTNPSGGCHNHGVGATSGAALNAVGVASLAADTVVLAASNERPGAITNVFWTGTGALAATGIAHAAGVRCVTADLRRLYTGASAGGAIFRPRSGDPSVSARTAAVSGGTPILPGETRHYFNLYRDSEAATPCMNSSSTVNLTNGGSITWAP